MFDVLAAKVSEPIKIWLKYLCSEEVIYRRFFCFNGLIKEFCLA